MIDMFLAAGGGEAAGLAAVLQAAGGHEGSGDQW